MSIVMSTKPNAARTAMSTKRPLPEFTKELMEEFRPILNGILEQNPTKRLHLEDMRLQLAEIAVRADTLYTRIAVMAYEYLCRLTDSAQKAALADNECYRHLLDCYNSNRKPSKKSR